MPACFYPTVDALMRKLFKTMREHSENENIPVSWKVDPVSEKLEVSFTGQTPEDQFWNLFKSIDLSKTLGVTDATRFARRPTYNVHSLWFGTKRNFWWLSSSVTESDPMATKRSIQHPLEQLATEPSTICNGSDWNRAIFNQPKSASVTRAVNWWLLWALVEPKSHCPFDDAKKTSSFG